MIFKLNVLIVLSFFLSVRFSEPNLVNKKSNQEKQIQIVEKPVIDIKANNIRKDKNHYLIDIYAENMSNSIAGIQFNLIGEDFVIVEVGGGLAEAAGFNFYNGAKGVVLAFSLEGETIAIPKTRTPLLTLKVQKSNNRASEFNLKTLIAGERGVKLESVFTPIVID